MLTEFLRDQAFTIAWLSVMAVGWFGWSQGDPKPRLRGWLALHFLALVWVSGDWSYLVLTAVQVAGLILMVPTLRRGTYQTSRWACPWIAVTFLLFALVFLVKHGYPF